MYERTDRSDVVVKTTERNKGQKRTAGEADKARRGGGREGRKKGGAKAQVTYSLESCVPTTFALLASLWSNNPPLCRSDPFRLLLKL